MTKEDIVGGLMLATQRGETLEQAMASFLNAGYKNEEIQEAARMLQSSPDISVPTQKPILKKPSPFNFFNKQPPQIPTNKPLTPVAKTTKNLMQAKPLQQAQPISQQPDGTAQSTSFSQHLEGVEDPAKVSPAQEPIQQPAITQPTIPQQVPPVQTPQPFKGTSLESHYESPKTSPRSIVIMILSTILVLLILSLGGVFLFKDALVGLFNNLF